MKYMLNQPLITGRIGKWSFTLSEFTLVYFSYKSSKGQALTDFLADHPSLEIETKQSMELGIYGAERNLGSSNLMVQAQKIQLVQE